MERKDKILLYMKSDAYIPLRYDELKLMLDVPASAEQEFQSILDTLITEGKIQCSKRGRYSATETGNNTVTGTLRCSGTGYFAFLIPDEEHQPDVYVHGTKLETALDGDRVLVKIDALNPRTGKQEGHVLRILERKNTVLSGVIESIHHDKLRIRPDSARIYAKLTAPKPDGIPVSIGDRVLAEITSYKPDGAVLSVVTKVLGSAESLKSNIDALLFVNGIKTEFDEETLKEAESIGQTVQERDLAGRLDLRDELIFTIDGADARDFDDAVSIKVLENGNYQLGVHIADVAHYVKKDTPLDQEAFLRGTSVYLADRVIPMLPERLSNGICSLNPQVDRLTLSVIMEVDRAGTVVDFTLSESVIRSKERMTYTDVAILLNGTDPELSARYKHLFPALEHMAALSKILYEKRHKRGSIDFDFPESKILVDEDGNPTDILQVERNDAHKLIEEFMLLANETIASYAYWSELPFVYRVHDAPELDKILELNRFLLNFGWSIKGKFDKDTAIRPKMLQLVLSQIKGSDEEQMISAMMLRSLMKAEYRPQNNGHFGLAAEYYCHFTSPIRRYPDLAIHRILKSFIKKQNLEQYNKFVASASVRSSEQERLAEQTERDVSDLMKAAYMTQFIGESFYGIISGVTSFGIFVQLENSVEGLIRLENIRDDYYVFDEDTRTLIGSRHQKVYRIGQAVDVTLVKTNLLTRQIDFIFTEDATFGTLSAIHRKSERKARTRRTQNDVRTVRRHKKNKRGRKHGSI